jgi:hypothetical protein
MGIAKVSKIALSASKRVAVFVSDTEGEAPCGCVSVVMEVGVWLVAFAFTI